MNTAREIKILLIGDIKKAFTNADAAKAFSVSVSPNILDGIEAAAGERFTAITVVMSDLPVQFDSALKALRKAGGGSKIILLADMYQEPAAMQLVCTRLNGTSLADDYLIGPVHSSHLASLFRERPKQTGISQRPGGEHFKLKDELAAAGDNETETRIKLLEKLATEDDLTGLKNRRYIRQFCSQIIQRAKNDNGQVTLLLFDIDNFKHYNDVYGHQAGDEILRRAATLMKRCCREHDIIGRIGGDEFAVIFWSLPQQQRSELRTERRTSAADHPKEVLAVAKRFSRELQSTELSPLGPEGKGVLTISGGLARFGADSIDTQGLFNQADKALLEAKRSGKNRIYLVGKPNNNIAEQSD